MSRVFFVLLCFFLASQLANAWPANGFIDLFSGECLDGLKITPDLPKVLAMFHNQSCHDIPTSRSPRCRFAKAHMNKQDLSHDEPQDERMKRDVQSVSGEALKVVLLNVYNLFETHPALNFLKCVDPDFNELDAIYYTSISYAGREYWYGFGGVTSLPEGTTPFGTKKVAHVFLATATYSSQHMDKLVDILVHHNGYTAENYKPLEFNANTFTYYFARVLKYQPVSKLYQESVTKAAKTDAGQLLKDVLRALKL